MHTEPLRKRTDREAGFTLVEVIVIVAVIAIVAGIVVPMIFSQIDEAKITRAEGDAKSIGSAVQVFRKDTGQWPNKGNGCLADVTLLVGSGTLPSNLTAFGFDDEGALSFSDLLQVDDNGCWPQRWKGPYLGTVAADPWGNAYLVNAAGFDVDGDSVWVYSAGPNGVMDSFAGAMTTNGDDIVTRIK